MFSSSVQLLFVQLCSSKSEGGSSGQVWGQVLDLEAEIVRLHTQSALEFCPIHCPNGRLGQDLGFGRFAFALTLPELLNTNLAAVRAKLGQTSCFPNGPQIWFPIGQ